MNEDVMKFSIWYKVFQNIQIWQILKYVHKKHKNNETVEAQKFTEWI